jgi:hypothetical protein
MNFDPTKLTGLDLFEDTRRFLLHSEPGYRAYLTLLTNGDGLVEEEWDGLEELFHLNAAEAAAFSNTGSHGDIVKMASVPRWKVAQWEDEADAQCSGDPDCKRKHIRNKLNDADNSKFRTNSWRV